VAIELNRAAAIAFYNTDNNINGALRRAVMGFISLNLLIILNSRITNGKFIIVSVDLHFYVYSFKEY
jgi:hypothetical protein